MIIVIVYVVNIFKFVKYTINKYGKNVNVKNRLLCVNKHNI